MERFFVPKDVDACINPGDSRRHFLPPADCCAKSEKVASNTEDAVKFGKAR
jgi:hypothetical protein